MLEKIGLPPKPSLRGNTWVVDASHCQGCSSQFSFINRKHHCRRCGGLFCGSCTQQRMFLRGQGDSPVRICEPCKKLEEAARFELRHGHKNRASKGSKLPSRSDDEVLNQILGNDGMGSVLSGRGAASGTVSSIHRAASSASCSNFQEVGTQDEGGEILRNLSIKEPNNVLMEIESASPEELRQQAVEEKKTYKILKAEGKHEEALRAFKRGKELERQAEALELSSRKNRKRASSSINMIEIQNIKDDPNNSGRKNALPPQKSKDKDDLAAELKELGWSDMDLHDAEQKKASMSLEGELSTLLGEVSQKPMAEKRAGGIDKTQIIAHKKKALALKREGNLAEAKEELKRAKVLEKQLEEQEFLAGFEDSDDELSSLIHGMDVDKQEDLSTSYELGTGFDVGSLGVLADDLGIDNNFEVTDEDMYDPEMVDALKSLGWSEEATHHEEIEPQLVSVDKEALLSEIQSLKREAVSKKRAGNIAEAKTLLMKAKELEKDLDNYPSQGTKISEVGVRNVDGRKDMDSNLAPKSRVLVQKELLSLKKRALALRREGRIHEADEELKKGKVLELQLEEMDNASKLKVAQVNMSNRHTDDFSTPDLEGEEDVTDHDMQDPTYLSLLSNLGWKDEADDHVTVPSKASKQRKTPSLKISDTSVAQAPTTVQAVQVGASRRSKGEIQRELIGLKRKAFSLRRQGKTEEADGVLEMAKVLEAQLAEIEAPKKEIRVETDKRIGNDIISSSLKTTLDEEDVSEEDMHDPALLSVLKNLGWNDQVEAATMQAEHSKQTASSSVHSDDQSVVPPEDLVVLPKRSKRDIQKEILGLKRKALSLRRQGETGQAEEILRTATLLEAQMEEVEAPKNEEPFDASNDNEPLNFGPSVTDGRNKTLDDGVQVNKDTSQAAGRHKRVVVERPTSAGSNEKDTTKPPPRSSDFSIPVMVQLENSDPPGETRNADGTGFNPPSGQSANIMDLLSGDDWRNSPSSILNLEDNWNSSSVSLSPVNSVLVSEKRHVEDLGSLKNVAYEKSEETVHLNQKSRIDESNPVHSTVSQNDRVSLQQEILAQKRRAVALKREGKLAEAREELWRAKLLEKSLEDGNKPPQHATDSSYVSSSTRDATSSEQKAPSSSNLAPKPLSSRERFKVQQESLSHKRAAMKLRREGRMEEADAESELAKALEAQLEESTAQNSATSAVGGAEPVNDVGVEDLLDPQLLSALKAIGLEHTSIVSPAPEKPEPAKPIVVKSENSIQERIELEERIKAEKVKALNLKRSGKQAEALDALRRAKMLEKKLNS